MATISGQVRPITDAFRSRVLARIAARGERGLGRSWLCDMAAPHGGMKAIEPMLASMIDAGLIERRVVPSGYRGIGTGVVYFAKEVAPC